jgi:hypothetical protein
MFDCGVEQVQTGGWRGTIKVTLVKARREHTDQNSAANAYIEHN